MQRLGDGALARSALPHFHTPHLRFAWSYSKASQVSEDESISHLLWGRASVWCKVPKAVLCCLWTSQAGTFLILWHFHATSLATVGVNFPSFHKQIPDKHNSKDHRELPLQPLSILQKNRKQRTSGISLVFGGGHYCLAHRKDAKLYESPLLSPVKIFHKHLLFSLMFSWDKKNHVVSGHTLGHQPAWLFWILDGKQVAQFIEELMLVYTGDRSGTQRDEEPQHKGHSWEREPSLSLFLPQFCWMVRL